MPALLIVCTANICRSPMAGALLRQHLSATDDDWRVETAGTWAAGGQRAARHGRAVMQEYGLDISEHRSRSIDDIQLNDFDLIITMERGHKEAIGIEFPNVADRVYVLSELASGGPAWDIRDPIGGPRDAFRDTAHELDTLLKEALPAIRAHVTGSTDTE